MGRTSKNGLRNRRTSSLDGFAYWWEDLAHNYQEKKELSKKPMAKQNNVDNSSTNRRTTTNRFVVQLRKVPSLATVPFTFLGRNIKKGLDKIRIILYNVYCSLHKRKDKIMSKNEDNKNTTKQNKNSKKTAKKETNSLLSGIITIGIAAAWISAAYCVVLVNTGTGNDMFPKYMSIPLAVVVAGIFLVAIYKTIKNNNR